MSTFKLVTGVFFPSANEGKGIVYPAGQLLDMDDDQAKPYVERGSIVPYDAEADAEAARPKPIEGEVVKEFSIDDFTYKLVDTNEGYKYTLNGQEIDQNAFETAYQNKVRQEETDRLTKENAPSDDQPSEEQLQNDFNAAGV